MSLVNKIVEQLSPRLVSKVQSALTDILTSPEFINEIEMAKAQAELSASDSILVAASKEAGTKGKKGRPKGSKNKPKTVTTEALDALMSNPEPESKATPVDQTLTEQEELYIAAD